MAAPRQDLPVRLERAPHRGAAFALSNASNRARARSIGSRSRGSLFSPPRSTGSLFIFRSSPAVGPAGPPLPCRLRPPLALRARRERPPSRRAREQRYELAPPHELPSDEAHNLAHKRVCASQRNLPAYVGSGSTPVIAVMSAARPLFPQQQIFAGTHRTAVSCRHNRASPSPVTCPLK